MGVVSLSTRFCVCSLIEFVYSLYGADFTRSQYKILCMLTYRNVDVNSTSAQSLSQYKILCMLTYSYYRLINTLLFGVSVQDFVYAHL